MLSAEQPLAASLLSCSVQSCVNVVCQPDKLMAARPSSKHVPGRGEKHQETGLGTGTPQELSHLGTGACSHSGQGPVSAQGAQSAGLCRVNE